MFGCISLSIVFYELNYEYHVLIMALHMWVHGNGDLMKGSMWNPHNLMSFSLIMACPQPVSENEYDFVT